MAPTSDTGAKHAVLASLGTDGDVFPYVGLGARLVARGWRVTLAAAERYAPLASRSGIEFRALVSDRDNDAMLADPDFWHPIKGGLIATRALGPQLAPQYELLAALMREGDATLVASPGVFAARVVQEKSGCPLVSILLQPGLIPSSSAPPIMAARLTLPKWAPRPLKQMYWQALDSIGGLLVRSHMRPLRQSLGLPPMRRMFRWWLSPTCVLGMFPEWFGEPQPDWPPQIRLCGFPVYDSTGNRDLDPRVLEFCRAQAPPIAFTFGTGMMHAAAMFQQCALACERLGMRGIFLTRHTAQLPPSLPSRILHVPFAPFNKLFPQCAAVVYHGGVGTAAEALAAATPQLALPLAYDQYDNATRLKKAGVGDWLRPRLRDAAHIADALRGLMTPHVRTRCRDASARMANQKNPFDIAADVIAQAAGLRGG